MIQGIATLIVVVGLIFIFIGTIGIFGFSYIRQITRTQAIQSLFLGFFLLIISGNIYTANTPEISNPTNQNLPSTTTTMTQNTQQQTVTTISSSNTSNTVKSNVTKTDTLDKLNSLLINDDFSSVPSYDRDLYFGSWEDFDNDCQNTRAEVLLEESLANVTFRKADQCVVDTGEWFDPYTGNTYFFASDLDVDHFVPLYDAWYSGAYLWTDYKRIDFANDLLYSDHLIAVDKGENRTKGKSSPAEWMPPNQGFHCEYVSIWVEIKWLWELTITSNEYKFIERTLSNC